MASLKHIWNGKKLTIKKQIKDPSNVCLQCANIRLGNMDPERNRQEKATGIRNVMLPK
ncbi:unnamed protein product, partial [Rotaria socialis]